MIKLLPIFAAVFLSLGCAVQEKDAKRLPIYSENCPSIEAVPDCRGKSDDAKY